MFEKITPEQAGIASAEIAGLIKILEDTGCVTHDILLMKGDKIFAEHYWEPFHKDFLHRQYSQTKSFVGVAIGLLVDDGKVKLDDPIVSYFPEKLDGPVPEYLAMQTVRDMLMMCTCGDPKIHWLWSEDYDRTHIYLNHSSADHKPGLRWKYDSPGTQVLCSLVEKLSGMPMLAFLKERLFNEMGVFQTARMLKCKNDDSWGDSAMLCTARDMAAFGLLVMRLGNWNGKQLMSADYLREATSALVNNDETGFNGAFRQGYGYQIWRTRQGFAFVGMGDQLTICIPEKELIFVIHSDNQGNSAARDIITEAFYHMIVERMADAPLPAAQPVEVGPLKLSSQKGRNFSPMMEKIAGKTFVCQKNQPGIVRFSFTFDEKGGQWHYTNAQGDKVLPFYWNENCYGKFPQDGYPTEHGGLPNTEGYRMNCATSAAWTNERQLTLRSQIIDVDYGNLTARFAFEDDDADVIMIKNAQSFLLDEYVGAITAKMQE